MDLQARTLKVRTMVSLRLLYKIYNFMCLFVPTVCTTRQGLLAFPGAIKVDPLR